VADCRHRRPQPRDCRLITGPSREPIFPLGSIS
jgi:hypothetical protein